MRCRLRQPQLQSKNDENSQELIKAGLNGLAKAPSFTAKTVLTEPQFVWLNVALGNKFSHLKARDVGTIQDHIITAMDKDRALPKAVRTFFGTHLVGQQVPKARPLCVQKVLEHVAKA